MTTIAFGLILVAALSHAGWNYCAKRVSGNLSVIWLGNWFASLLCLPFTIYFVSISGLSLQDLRFLALVALIHTLYFYYVHRVYLRGEISTVYPLARGIGVGGTALLAAFVMEEPLSPLGILGIACVCGGALTLGLKNWRLREGREILFSCVGLGGTIVGYTLTDKLGVQVIHPVIYVFAIYFLPSVYLSPLILLSARRHEMRQAWGNLKRYAVLVGVGSMATYLLILFTLTLSRASYVAAVREVSVAFGAILGITLLGERFSIRRGLGIAVILFGLICIRWS
jgi:drug/metabolite transporter (DMT)-like permease